MLLSVNYFFNMLPHLTLF